MERFCDELRWERERRQVSIEAICAATKVAARHLHALEAGEYDALPGGVFRKGILRGYLSVLQLDEATWVKRFEASLREAGGNGDGEADWAEFAENVRNSRVAPGAPTGMRWLGVAAMVGTLMMIALAVWRFVLHG